MIGVKGCVIGFLAWLGRRWLLGCVAYAYLAF